MKEGRPVYGATTAVNMKFYFAGARCDTPCRFRAAADPQRWWRGSSDGVASASRATLYNCSDYPPPLSVRCASTKKVPRGTIALADATFMYDEQHDAPKTKDAKRHGVNSSRKGARK